MKEVNLGLFIGIKMGMKNFGIREFSYLSKKEMMVTSLVLQIFINY